MGLKTTIPRSRVCKGARSCGSPQGPKPRPAELQASRSRGTLLSRKSSLAPSKPFRWKRARSCKAAWRRSCCPQRFHGPRLRGSLGSRQSWDLNRSPQAHYPTRLRGFGKPSILRLMGRGSPAAPGPQNRKIEKAPSAISPSILPKPTPVPKHPTKIREAHPRHF